jgi:predicted nucleic acid-binding protein
MSKFLPDTSCMVAVVCAWHEYHEPVAEEFERRLGMGEVMVVAAPALVETYAVLTRLPPPHRIAPGDAFALIEANFMSSETVALNGESYHHLLRQAPKDGVAGGRTYDAVIAACAIQARASALLTLNVRQFMSFATNELEIIVPGEVRR